MEKERLVVIGNGISGAACVEEILKLAPQRFAITVFGAESHVNYNRVLLSQVLTGEKTLGDITVHGRQWYEQKGVKLFTGCRVSGIRRKSRIAVAENGEDARYSKLILATGAQSVVPNIPGADKEGVVSFRDMDDCERIRALVLAQGAGKRRAVVIGGGLIGLEAAYALKSIGAEVSVVHLMPHLMERQLDPTAAGFLKEEIERLGINVLVGKDTAEVSGDGRVEGLRFKDGGAIEADVVVMAVGIRPNVELARASGIYCEKGIVVSDTMQTYDPAVYAVGECVQHRGATFGLVASVFEQARVLANHLAGDSRLVFRNRPASVKLKVPGINVYSAGRTDEAKDCEPIEYMDRAARTYKKLLIKNGRIEGIILYGDTLDGPALFASLLEGEDVSDRRGRLLAGSAMPSRGGSAPDDMPLDAIVCGCNGVTKGMIVDAIEKKGLFTREDVKRETMASSSCGGCAGAVDRILEASLGGAFQSGAEAAALCACTKYTRDDVIKNIRERGLESVKDVMETLGWETVGCETCRPAINYYVSMIWPAKGEDDVTSRLINERVHANIQNDGRFSVVPRMYGGVVRADELRRLADAADRYGVPLIKITGGQRIGLFGVRRDDLASVWKDVGMPSGYAYGKALRTVKTCVGSNFCRYGTQDSLTLGIELEKMLEGLWMPAKVKLGVSGCPRSCAEHGIKDVGILGVAGGFEIYAGGCGGIELSGGEILRRVKTKEEVMETVAAFLQYYREEARYGERTFRWIRRMGINAVKKAVADDAQSRNLLCQRLHEALSGRMDPWKTRINEPAAAGRGPRD
ncbi:MAG: NAD(P)/FAD-dependent oxidoreductase [Deltaproteobacteria bacterium]|nr:NAD(P)/FAD-dependent oxidoreductase [Deltaproteobacteria bacterium]